MKNKETKIEQDMAPFGFVDDGLGEDTFIDGEGNLWEYGSSEVDVEYMWNY